ncbi:putative modified peptide [Kribbella sandramycini]|uniref:Putative modified peptide n=1 Tax=Kribbella sandramycini TaxID=60450 RepID=A0A7Y4KYR5_9ACTN|nr:NHLP-related RiPP peptide [Kribbella sandramycini]MBB6569013.1 putative modified peptide [Kribbella sandramycini]NOL41143.1 putative modified peptide [Kribbella sandramycini]
MTVTTRKPQLPAPVVDRLLDLLATDDAFRDLFAHDRQAALTAVGCETPDGFGCLAVDRLAAKTVIAAARDELRAYLLSGAAYNNPHILESGATHAVLRHN